MFLNYQKSLIISPIGAILLDVENFPHLLDIEKQIKPHCKYPIALKYAAANWTNNTLAKLDLYLHKQRYQLFHVPQAKNAADNQLLAVGYLLITQYPHCQELTIVSNDSIFNYLHESFQAQGYKSYKVYQQSGNIYFYDFSCDRTILISTLANNHQTQKTQFKKETTLTQSEEHNLVNQKSNNQQKKNKSSGKQIQENIEKLLLKLIKKKQEQIPLLSLCQQFKNDYKQSLSQMLKAEGLNQSPAKFLKNNCPEKFEFTKNNGNYYITRKI